MWCHFPCSLDVFSKAFIVLSIASIFIDPSAKFGIWAKWFLSPFVFCLNLFCFAYLRAYCRHHACIIFYCLLPCSEMTWQHSSTRWAWVVNHQETTLNRRLVLCTHHLSCSSLPSRQVILWLLQVSSFPQEALQVQVHQDLNQCCSHHLHPRALCNNHHHLLRYA